MLQLVDEASGGSASSESELAPSPDLSGDYNTATSGHSRAGGVFVYQIPAVLYAGAAVRGSKDVVRFAVSVGSEEVPSKEVPSSVPPATTTLQTILIPSLFWADFYLS